jgi:hypothetical protein
LKKLLIIELTKKQLKERLNSDCKQILSSIEIKRLALSYQLGMKIVNYKFNWWFLRTYKIGKNLEQTWEEYYKDNFKKVLIGMDKNILV